MNRADRGCVDGREPPNDRHAAISEAAQPDCYEALRSRGRFERRLIGSRRAFNRNPETPARKGRPR